MKQGWFSSRHVATAGHDSLWPHNGPGGPLVRSRSVQDRLIGVIRAGRAAPYRRSNGGRVACSARYGRVDDAVRGAEPMRLRGR